MGVVQSHSGWNQVNKTPRKPPPKSCAQTPHKNTWWRKKDDGQEEKRVLSLHTQAHEACTLLQIMMNGEESGADGNGCGWLRASTPRRILTEATQTKN